MKYSLMISDTHKAIDLHPVRQEEATRVDIVCEHFKP